MCHDFDKLYEPQGTLISTYGALHSENDAPVTIRLRHSYVKLLCIPFQFAPFSFHNISFFNTVVNHCKTMIPALTTLLQKSELLSEKAQKGNYWPVKNCFPIPDTDHLCLLQQSTSETFHK